MSERNTGGKNMKTLLKNRGGQFGSHNGKRKIAFNFRKDGTIRAYQADTKDKRGVSEFGIITPVYGVAPTITTIHAPLVYYEDADTVK